MSPFTRCFPVQDSDKIYGSLNVKCFCWKLKPRYVIIAENII